MGHCCAKFIYIKKSVYLISNNSTKKDVKSTDQGDQTAAEIEEGTVEISEENKRRNELEKYYLSAKRLNPEFPRFSEGDCILAIFDYAAHSDEELSFQKNDIFKIISIEDKDWILVRFLDAEESGYVPSCYVAPINSFEIFDWYHGSIPRRKAESYLINEEEGTFLIRDSVNHPGELALSIKVNCNKFKTSVRHMMLDREDGKFSIWGTKWFPTVHELVEEYKVDQHDLPSALLMPYPKPQPEMSVLSFKTKKNWAIDHKEVKLFRELPCGNYARTFRGKWYGGVEVAVKTYSRGDMTEEEFVKEVTFIKELIHPNIVQLYAACCSEPVYLVMPYFENGSLHRLLRAYKNTNSFDSQHMVEFLAQIAQGMEYLEEKNYVHRNLTSLNVFIDRSFTCRVADIGHAAILEKVTDKKIALTKAPTRWSPPEVFQDGLFSTKSDIWSFAIVAIEIFTYGEPLYCGMTEEQVKEKVLSGYRLPQPPLCPHILYDELKKCWNITPEDRPSFKTMKSVVDKSID